MATARTINPPNVPRCKRALLIGISNYDDGQNLPNAVNDAKDMSSALKRIGFLIDGDGPKLNPTRKQILHIFIDFQDSIKTGDMVVFYFAGHGRQWEV